MPFGISNSVDVVVGLYRHKGMESIKVQNLCCSPIVDAELKLLGGAPGWGVFFFRHWVEVTPPSGEDRAAIAERIALSCESDYGLKVRRLVTDPQSFDKSPSKPVQSFILA